MNRFLVLTWLACLSVARVTQGAPGTVDPAFDPGSGPEYYLSPGSLSSIAVQTDGKILAGGFFDTFGGFDRKGIARLNTDGSLDATFNPGSGAEYLYDVGGVFSIAVQPNGKVL